MRKDPPLRNIPIRTDLGKKLREALFGQRVAPGKQPIFYNTGFNESFSNLEARIHARYCGLTEDASCRNLRKVDTP